MKILNPTLTATTATFARASTGTYWNYDGSLQTAAINEQRFNWNRETLVFNGVLVEPERTNLLLNSAALVTQTRSVTPGVVYTLSFYGNATIVLTGAADATVVGHSGTRRTDHTFTAAAGSLTLNVLGAAQYAQLEAGEEATSVIITAGSPVTRAPDVITGTGLFYTSFTDATPAYSGVTTYAIDTVVAYGIRLYTSLQNTNLAHTPDVSPTWWADAGPNNVFACLDNTVSTATVGPVGEHRFAIKYPSDVDALAALNIDVTSIHLVMSNGYKNFNQVYKDGTPSNAMLSVTQAGNIVTVAVRKDTGEPSLGEIVCGTTHVLGDTQYGFSASLVDYSKKQTDEFGVTTFVPRGFAKRATAKIVVEKSNYNAVVDLLQAVRATPTVFIATDDEAYSSGALIYGFPESFDIEIAYPTISICTLQVQGLL